MTSAELREKQMLAERAALSAEQRETFERVEAERDRAVANARMERDLRIDVERDRNRGWNLARYYHSQARSMLHALGNARQMVMGLLPPQAEPPKWVEFEVPFDMEAPIPRTETDSGRLQ